jgi:hypothetical protein
MFCFFWGGGAALAWPTVTAPPKKRKKNAGGHDFDGLYNPDRGSDGDFDNPHGDWLVFGPPPPPGGDAVMH